MLEDDVPQDQIKTYQGMRKLLYAVDEQGRYTEVNSQGWEVEEFVNAMAVEELNALASEALSNYKTGHSSPLEYFMYHHRLDLPQLAQAVGLFRWRVKRHMRPQVWAKLNNKLLQRYADVFGMSIEEFASIKDARE